MIKVGQKVRFDPFAEVTGFGSNDNRGNYVTGTVVLVNYKNEWFSVIYGSPEQRTSFKFSDIGDGVTICGR